MNVAVVLTHTRAGGLPSLEGAARLEHAVRLLQDETADLLLIGGGLPAPDGRSLADVYRDYLVHVRHVDPAHILVEATSRDTAETLRHIPQVLATRLEAPPERIFLISNRDHLRRAMRTVAQLRDWRAMIVQPVPSPSTLGRKEAVRERLLDLYAMVDPCWTSPVAEFMRRRRARLVASGASRAFSGTTTPLESTNRIAVNLRVRRPSRSTVTAKDVPPGNVVAGIPCFNEAPYIGSIVKALEGLVDVVVVVDDGSTDDTAWVAREAGAEVIRHERNRGYGAAIRSCFEAAIRLGADVLVTLDGDGQHDPAQVPALLRPLLEDEADMVIGSRHLGEFSGIPAYRRVGIAIITGLFNVGAARHITDAQSGYRAYRRRVLEGLSLSETGMGASVEILIKARSEGFRIAEVPITCTYHASSSTLHPVRHGVGVAWKVVEHRARTALSRRHRHGWPGEDA